MTLGQVLVCTGVTSKQIFEISLLEHLPFSSKQIFLYVRAGEINIGRGLDTLSYSCLLYPCEKGTEICNIGRGLIIMDFFY